MHRKTAKVYVDGKEKKHRVWEMKDGGKAKFFYLTKTKNKVDITPEIKQGKFVMKKKMAK